MAVLPSDLSAALGPVRNLWRRDELHILQEIGAAVRKTLVDDDYDDDTLDYIIFEIIFADLKKSTPWEKRGFTTVMRKISEHTDDTSEIFQTWYRTTHRDISKIATEAHRGAYRIFREVIRDLAPEIDNIGTEATIAEICDHIADNFAPVKTSGDRQRYLSQLIAESYLTGMNRAAAEAEIEAARQGDGIIEVSAHHGARPTHQVWQGRLYAIDGPREYNGETLPDFVTSTGYGTGPGLCGYNCRHSFWAKPLGEPRKYTDEYLDHLMTATANFGGEIMTEYELEQKRNYYRRQRDHWQNRNWARIGAGISTTETEAKMYHYEGLIDALDRTLRRMRER